MRTLLVRLARSDYVFVSQPPGPEDPAGHEKDRNGYC